MQDDVREVHRRVNRPRGVHVGLDVHANRIQRSDGSSLPVALAVVALGALQALLRLLGIRLGIWPGGLLLLGVGVRRRGFVPLSLEPLQDEGNEGFERDERGEVLNLLLLARRPRKPANGGEASRVGGADPRELRRRGRPERAPLVAVAAEGGGGEEVLGAVVHRRAERPGSRIDSQPRQHREQLGGALGIVPDPAVRTFLANGGGGSGGCGALDRGHRTSGGGAAARGPSSRRRRRPGDLNRGENLRSEPTPLFVLVQLNRRLAIALAPAGQRA